MKPLQLDRTYAVLGPDLRVTPIPVTPGVYEELDARFAGFKSHVLVSLFAFDRDWPTWEIHPAGDEIVVLLSGRATLKLQTREGERQTVLSEAGSYFVVPRNTWHTAKTSEHTRMLFITPGEGTENRIEE
jgi:mannose-6-phosphate isomerase-like protein (cupin superfamily)